jgi:thymidylate synthase (FAD)
VSSLATGSTEATVEGVRSTFDPLGDGISRLELVDHMGSDHRVVQAARVSYARDLTPWDESRDPRLIQYLVDHGHWSCFEHCYLTVLVECPLFVARQWMRHRSWNFNEVSRRYTSEDIKFYVPSNWRTQHSKNKQSSSLEDVANSWKADEHRHIATSVANTAYEQLLNLGVAREQARIVLPQSLYTRYYATASLRSVIHFLQSRDHEDAQWEIQQYSKALREIMKELWPMTYQAVWKEE